GGTNQAVEIYTVGTGWSAEYVASWTPPLYPRMHLLPSGKVFFSGSSTISRLFDPSAHTWGAPLATTISSTTRTYGSSVLLPLTTLRADTRFVNASTLKLPSPDAYDVAIVAFFVRVSDRKGNVDVPPEQVGLAEQIYKTGKPVITVAFGSPYLIEGFPQAETWLAA